MLQYLLLSLLVSTPDPSTRTHAWRVVDQVSGSYRCEYACSTTATDEARDTACIQAAINTATSSTVLKYRAVEAPAGDCLITTTLTVADVRNFELFGQGASRTRFIWNDAGAANPVLLLNDVRDSRFHDFGVAPAFGKTITTGIRISNSAGATVVPTNNTFERILVDALSGSLVNGFEIDADGAGGASNNDFHRFVTCGVNANSGDAFRIEPSQSKTNVFEQCSCLGSSRWGVSSVDIATDIITLNASVSAWAALNDAVVLYQTFPSALAVTSDITTDRLTFGVSHTLSINDPVILSALVDTTGVSAGVVYYVKTSGTAWITLSATPGGALLDLTGSNGSAWVSSAALPGGISRATTYYIRSFPTASSVTLSASSGAQPLAILDITSAGMGSMRMKPLAEASHCVNNINGSFHWSGGGGGYMSDYDFNITNLAEPSSITGYNSECSRKFLYKAGATAEIVPLAVTGVRWATECVALDATSAEQRIVSTGHQGVLTIIGSSFTSHGETGARALGFYLNPIRSAASSFIGSDIATSLSVASAFPGGFPTMVGNLNWSQTRQQAKGFAATNEVVNAADFGVTANGATDDTVAMQDAIDATANGGTLRLPIGVIVVSSTLTRTTPITIVGSGPPSSLVRDVFGGGGYGLLTATGTAIRSAATTGTVLALGDVSGGHYSLRDFAVVGSGDDTRTTIGISATGGGAFIADFDHIMVSNMKIGIACLDTCEDGRFGGLLLYGNDVGFWGDGDTNSNVFTGIDCGANNICGHILGSTNNFVGGTVQGSYQYGFRVQNGENHFSDIYFEDNSAVGAAISLEKASSWVLTDLDAGTDVITLDAAAPADDTQVYLWVDGSTSTLPAAVSEGTAYFVDDSSGNTMKLRTAASPAGSYIDFATAGTVLTAPGRTRMTVVTAAPGYANYVDNNHYATGDDISVWTGDNRIDEINFSQTLTLHKGTAGNVVLAAASCTDQGTGNYCEKRPNGNGGIDYVFSPLSVSSPGMFWSGPSRLFFDMATAGGLRLSYECRDDLTYCQFRDSSAEDDQYLSFKAFAAGADDNYVVINANHFSVGNETTIGGILTVNTIDSTGAGTTVEGVLVNNGDITADVINPPAGGAQIDLTSSDVLNFTASAAVNFTTAGLDVAGALSCDGNFTLGGDINMDALATVDGADVSVLNTLATTLAAGIRDVKATCGAVGDGTTDDTTALSNCISGTASGGSIYFPPGVYRTTAPLVLAAPISLIGPGVPSSSSIPAYADAGWAGVTYSGAVIRSAASSGNLITSGPMTTHRVTISNIGFASTVAGAHTTIGLFVDGTSGGAPRVYLHNVAFYNLSGGLECYTCYASQFDHVLGGGSRYPLYLDVNSHGNTVIAPYLYLAVTGMFILGNQNTVQSGFVYNSGTVGFDIRGSSNVVEGVYFQTGAAITVTSTGKGNVLKNTYVDINAVSVAGVGNRVWRNGGYACPAVTWASGAAYNVADDTEYNAACTYTDNSGNATNTRTYPNANGILFDQGITAAGAIIDGGDFTVASGTDFVKTDLVEEYTSTAGVKVDSSGGASTTTTIKDGYVAGIGFTSVDGTCGLSVTNDTTDAMTLAAGVLTANVTTFDVNGDLTPDKVTIGAGGGGNVAHTLYNHYFSGSTGQPSGTSIETVVTVTVPGGLADTDGDTVVVTGTILKDADAVNTVFEVNHSGVIQFVADASTVASLSWYFYLEVQRVDASTARLTRWYTEGNSLIASGNFVLGDPTWTWASNQDIVVRITNPTAANDSALVSFRVDFVPAVP